MAVIPETILEGEGVVAFMCRVAVERVCPVAGANGIEVFVDGDVCSDIVEKGVVLVVRASRKWVSQVCLSWSPFDGVFVTPDFLDPS